MVSKNPPNVLQGVRREVRPLRYRALAAGPRDADPGLHIPPTLLRMRHVRSTLAGR